MDDPLVAEELQPLQSGIDLRAQEEGSTASSPSRPPGVEECGIASCRVCLEDDDVQRLVEPCSCTGSMMYAHQACIQRWIDEKGDRTCEICHGPFSTSFADPPPPPPQQRSPIPSVALLLAMPHSQGDEYADDTEYDRGGMRGMSLALAFMCMLTVTQVFQMIGASGDDTGHNPSSSSFDIYREPSTGGTVGGQPATVGVQLGLAGLMLASMLLRLILVLIPIFVVCRVLTLMRSASLRSYPAAAEPRLRLLDRERLSVVQAMEEGTHRLVVSAAPLSGRHSSPPGVELAQRTGL